MKKLISVILVLVLVLITASAFADVIYQKGDKGDGVSKLQTLLTEKGYSLGKIDGDYGNATFKAVQAFQTDNGLEVTGIVDTLTYEKLLGWADCEHQYDEWKNTEEPTCTTTGTRMHTCSLCGKYEYEDIPATGHTLINSPTGNGKVCSVCGLIDKTLRIGAKIDSTNHSFEVVDVYYATELTESIGGTVWATTIGSPMTFVKLSFTNLSTQTLPELGSGRITNAKLTYDNKYVYEGEYYLFGDIVPLGTRYLYIGYVSPDVITNNTDIPLLAEFTIDGETYELRIV